MLNYLPHTQSDLTRFPKGGEMRRSEGKRMGGCDSCIIIIYSNWSVLNSLIDIHCFSVWACCLVTPVETRILIICWTTLRYAIQSSLMLRTLRQHNWYPMIVGKLFRLHHWSHTKRWNREWMRKVTIYFFSSHVSWHNADNRFGYNDYWHLMLSNRWRAELLCIMMLC